MPELDWLEMWPNASWCIGFQVPKCVVMHQLRLFFQIFPWVNRSKYLSFKSAQCDPFIYGKIWKKSRGWCITTHWVNLKPDASWHIWPHLESIQLRHNKYDLIILKYIHTYLYIQAAWHKDLFICKKPWRGAAAIFFTQNRKCLSNKWLKLTWKKYQMPRSLVVIYVDKFNIYPSSIVVG